MKASLLILITVFIISGCNNDHSGALKKTDSLLQVTGSIDTLIAALELDSAKERYSAMKKDVEFFGTHMIDLPENPLHRAKVSEYANISKGFKRIFKEMIGYRNDNLFNRNQLENLRADISKGRLSSEEISKYLNEEALQVTNLHAKLKEADIKYKRLCSEATACLPVVQAVTDSLKKAKRIP